MSKAKPNLVISIGDPSGIGPEIILKSLAKANVGKLGNFIIVGDYTVLKKTAASLGASYESILNKFSVITKSEFDVKKNAHLPFSKYPAVIDLKNVPLKYFSFGKEDAAYGKASVEYIKTAFEITRRQIADCIVTAPLNKAAVKKAGFAFPGHTEYLAHLAGVGKIVMMLCGGPLRVSLVTRHIPISKVPRSLTCQNIGDVIKITLDALRREFGIKKPRIGVCGLNPHSGEGGIFGKEEKKIILPAVRKFSKGMVFGPAPADALFYDAYRGRFDALICMYHDQGLIPLKMIARDIGVNVTLGLGYIRTSPDHGTAFDIAGKNMAKSSSMEMAIRLAITMAENRRRHR